MISTRMWGHSHSVTRQVMACGSSSRVLASSCSRTSSATQSASGVSVTTSGGKKGGPSGRSAMTRSVSALDAPPAAGRHREVLDPGQVAQRVDGGLGLGQALRAPGRPTPGRSCSRRPPEPAAPRRRHRRRYGRRHGRPVGTTSGVAPPSHRRCTWRTARSSTVRSPGPMAAVASTTARITSTSLSASVAVSFRRVPSALLGRWMPGVSTKTTCASAASSCSTPRMRWRVVFGRDEVIATLVPTILFTSVDLPTLGRPTTATKPERTRSAPVVRRIARPLAAAPAGPRRRYRRLRRRRRLPPSARSGPG